MGEPVKITLDVDLLKTIQAKAQRIAGPTVPYTANTETYLKNVVAYQRDIGGEIDGIINNILFGN